MGIPRHQIRSLTTLVTDDALRVSLWDGTERTIPLTDVEPFTRHGCRSCNDYLGETADIAVGALGIEPGPKWYSPQTMNDQRIIEFRKRVEVQYDPELDKIDIPQGKILWKFPTSVEVTSKKGVFRASTEYTKGDPWTEETYFPDDELKKKFLIFASSVFDGSEKWLQQMDSVIDMVFNAERLVNVAELCDSLGPRSLST